ncbi:integrase core domain-containing protein, partial [Prauserella endophytica]
ELRQLEHFATKAQARRRIPAWIEEYNYDRRHSSLGMCSPVAFEHQLARITSTTSPKDGRPPRAVSAPPAPEDDVVLTGVKAHPSGRPPAGLDPGCGRRPQAASGKPRGGLQEPQIHVSTVSRDCRSTSQRRRARQMRAALCFLPSVLLRS